VTGRSSSCPPSRCTASAPGKWGPTRSEAPAALAALKSELAAFYAEPLAGANGLDLARRRADAVDEAVRALFAPCGAPGLALAAIGGYGRRELTPGSDIDLLFLHSGLSEDFVRQAVDAVLYPLWDTGMRVSHAVRTVEECGAESRKALFTLTALLDARLLEGSAELVEAARKTVLHIAREDPRSLAGELLAEQADRDRRFGALWRTVQPDLKEGVGGLRDIQVVRWIGAAGDAAGPEERVEAALELFLRVRMAMHVIGGSGSNGLMAELQGAVADSLGYTVADGWEPRDALMRDVFAAARRVHAATLEATTVEPPPPPRSLADFLQGSLGEPDTLGHPLATEWVGSLAAIGPVWNRVQGRPQRDPYHRYPVDVHLLQTVRDVVRLFRGSLEPFVAEAVRFIGDPMPLLMGALFHDIGKVGEGSHVATGVLVATDVLKGLGTDERLRDDVLFLVGEHLLLSDTATRRNLEDEDLIVQVAARIGDRRRLAMLYLLTVADAMATGPTAFTPWRMTLIRDLVAKVDHVFERGLMDEDRAGRLAAAQGALGVALAASGSSDDRIAMFLGTVPPDYLLRTSPDQAVHHLDLILPPPAEGEVRTDVRPGRSSETYRVAVGAVDRLGLLAAVAGSFTLAGLSILSAHAFTTEMGIALDLFEVRGAFEEEVDDRRWGRFRTTLRDALAGSDLGEKVRSLRSHYRPAGTDVAVTVNVDQEASDFFTVVEVGGRDRLGLLFDLARTFSDHGLDVHVGKVATYGPRVVDIFYVRDEQGQKVQDPERVLELIRALRDAASGG
jgi:[protein-PII] uridylyltransferase